MKRISILFLALFAAVFFTSCQKKEETAVYSISGENESFTVSNGVVMLNGEEQAFSGGDLTVKGVLPEIFSCNMSYFLQLEGEEHTLLSFGMKNHTGEPLDINGDIGTVSGRSIFPVREGVSTREYLDHIVFRLAAVDSNGVETVYELPMTVKIVFE